MDKPVVAPGRQSVITFENRYISDEEVKRSMEWLLKRLVKVGAKVAYHGRR